MTRPGEKLAVTGANGFLGFHVRALVRAQGMLVENVPLGSSFSSESALTAIDGTSRLLHLAGVNRGTDAEVGEGNITFAKQLGKILHECKAPPATIVFANSIQSGNGSVYGDSKRQAADVLRQAAENVGSNFVELMLPNLFGEHGRPFYNSVTATFCHLTARRETAHVQNDSALSLLHAQYAAELLLGFRPVEEMMSLQAHVTVGSLLDKIQTIAASYRNGAIPSIVSAFDRDLFNTYRSYLSDEERLIPLDRKADSRGSFFEVVRAVGSSNQTSFSTTVPGVTRGDHFHLRKIERFSVLSGSARISMRRLFTGELVSFDVDGNNPVAIDMPTMWAHNITNTGSEVLYTLFWANELFDPKAPDTFAEEV